MKLRILDVVLAMLYGTIKTTVSCYTCSVLSMYSNIIYGLVPFG